MQTTATKPKIVTRKTYSTHVYVYVKGAPFPLVPQCQLVLNLIQQHSPITRVNLLIKLGELKQNGELKTKNTVATVLNQMSQILRRCDAIMTLTSEEWLHMREFAEDIKLGGMIKQHHDGLWSIHTPPDNRYGIGHFETEDLARKNFRDNLEKRNLEQTMQAEAARELMTPEQYEASQGQTNQSEIKPEVPPAVEKASEPVEIPMKDKVIW